MEHYGKRALEHAKAIAKPRRTGSPGEIEARNYINNQLRALGYRVSEEPFTFQPLDETRWQPYLAGLILFCLLIPLSKSYGFAYAVPILATGLLLYGFGAGIYHRHLIRTALLGKSAQSANLFATPPGPPCFGPRVLLCAHYDSKSQRISLRGRIFWIVLTVVSSLALITFSWLETSAQWINSAAVLAGVGAIALFFCKTENHSPGATDNAAPVGILLELAERLRLSGTPHGTEIAFFFSGAEEEETVGALAFLHEHAGALQERPHQIINLDILGHGGKLYLWSVGKHSLPAEQRVLAAAAQEKITLARLPFVLGAAADHIPFASAGVPAVTITSPFGVLGKVHTHRDEVTLLREEELGKIVRLLQYSVTQQHTNLISV